MLLINYILIYQKPNNILMKIKHLLIGLFAVAAAVACKQDEPVETPKLDVDKTAVSLAATAGEASFNVTSNQSWVASADADWVSLEPASGQASEKAVAVKVTAEDNETAEARKATVTVKAGELTKTVEVNQAAGAGEQPGPGPELPQSEWALVGSFNGWDPASETYLSILDEEYFVIYGFELASDTEFKFLKGGAWPPAGQEVGGNGLVEPNTIQPAGGSNIKVTEAGKYDIYLAADLTKFYVMSEGKLPSEATEPAPVDNQWGMMGCFVDNQWGSDVPMTKEGEWIVAKGAQFTELTFKIRANASWADATNIDLAPGSERGVVNGKISVVTAEYSKANLGGDAADIKLNGAAGTYDVYFSFENLEVYVMEEGFKPGEKEPQTPDPVEITYTVVGTIADNAWVNNAAAGLMAKEGDLYVAKNVPFVWNSTCYGGDYNRIEFKIVETGTWDGFAYPEKNVDQYANAEITVQNGGENIAVDAPEGNYDVYFDKANLKVWVMEAGFKPGEKEPLVPSTGDYDIDGKQWTFAWQGMGGASCVIDLGVTEPGVAILAYDMGVLDPSYAGIYYPYMMGAYTIAKTDGTSGVVTLSADGQSVEIPYSNATENTVHFESAALLDGENIDCTLATSLIEISTGAAEGLADGEYWIIADGKVATPLTSNYGYLNVVDAVDGKSTAANAFTFTQVDAGLYTIQDSNGKYYYQTGTYNSFNVADKDGGTDEYLWEVYDSGNGTFVIMNYEVGKFMQYDSNYNSYGSYSDERGTLPTLVLAEDPIAEPEPEPTPDGAYTYTFVSGDLKSSEVTLGGVTWAFAMTDTNGGKYIGWDSNNVKGVQIGKKADPATDVTLSTSGITGKIVSIKVNTSGASGTDAKFEVTVGGNAYGSQVSLTTTATDYTFEGAAEGEVVLHWTATTAAIYVKSIEIVTE